MRRGAGVACLLAVLGLLALPHLAHAAGTMRLELDGGDAGQGGTALKMLLALTAVTLLPAALLATTSFLRIAVVLSFMRSALGAQNMPPTQVLTGLALFITCAIMAPIGSRVYEDAIEPYLDGDLQVGAALEEGSKPLRTFMLKQTRSADLALFYNLHDAPRPDRPSDVRMHLLIPAFIISELRTAFEMGFILYMPFLLIDMVVASVLMAMGMVMVPPAMISLPVKIMLFVLADGWNVLVGSLVRSFA